MDVIFFPRKDYDVEVCAHRYGKLMTYTDQSDQLKFVNSPTMTFEEQMEKGKSYDWITALGKRYGIKLGFFAYYSEPTQADFTAKALADLDNGDIWIDQYSYTPITMPAVTPDISADTFRDAYRTYLKPPFLEKTGKKPVALSYSYGVHTFDDATCPLYLAGRHSGDANCKGTDYGVGYGIDENGDVSDIPYSMEAYKSKPSSYRWWDRAQALISGGTAAATAYQTAIGNVADAIDATLANGGWFRNFTHYHSMMKEDATSRYYAEQYYAMLDAKNTDGQIHFAGYGEAVAYLVYRQIVRRAVMYSPKTCADTQLHIMLETYNNLRVDEDLLQVPISVKFSTAGTPLEGEALGSTCNLISLGNDEYIVEIPYARFPKAEIVKSE